MAFPSGGSWVWLDGKRLNVISSDEMRVLPDGVLAAKDTLRTDLSISDEMVPSIVAEDGIALRVYCLLAEGPQNVVEASANSLWQGGWRRTHSVKGGLPK